MVPAVHEPRDEALDGESARLEDTVVQPKTSDGAKVLVEVPFGANRGYAGEGVLVVEKVLLSPDIMGEKLYSTGCFFEKIPSFFW